jgi:hypothetical protein
MTVKELIHELLECDMDADVSLLLDFNDATEDFSEFTVKHEPWGTGKKYVELTVEFGRMKREEF